MRRKTADEYSEERFAVKKYSAVLTLFFLTFAISAQSVWTGNASVGGSSDFPGKSDVFRAASNSFPEGTVLKVTNPRGGAEVDVTVTGRLKTPGIFILIEEEAASNIGLPFDHVLPVRVTPIAQASEVEPKAVLEETGELTEDTDYNPASGIPENPMVKPAESETIVTYNLADEKPEAENDKNSEYDASSGTPDETAGSKIFFLTPSDLRPPEVPASVGKAEISEPVYTSENAEQYVQVGSYRSRTVLEDALNGLKAIAPVYPLSVDSVSNKDGTIYKLLIGPLSPAEIGIVLKTARSTVFPDAFPYSP
ncbi:MAG: hypothetical protein DRZ90_15435 [Spirochaetes bacterium]|nr:MAG: hypothetical protein DRP60_01370 [Spirochaetota bacterium]RKX91152.1 MAG: hypothetical protein DRZ90_15435 [Spirochaetota bacterium]